MFWEILFSVLIAVLIRDLIVCGIKKIYNYKKHYKGKKSAKAVKEKADYMLKIGHTCMNCKWHSENEYENWCSCSKGEIDHVTGKPLEDICFLRIGTKECNWEKKDD